jgi:hypothetical protein
LPGIPAKTHGQSQRFFEVEATQTRLESFISGRTLIQSTLQGINMADLEVLRGGGKRLFNKAGASTDPHSGPECRTSNGS